jgi:31-O-methyltransferase
VAGGGTAQERIDALARMLRHYDTPQLSFQLAEIAGERTYLRHEHALSRAPGHLSLTYYPGAAAMSGLYADPRRDAALVRTVLVNSGVEPATADERLAGAHDPVPLTCEARTLSSVLEELALARVDLLKIDVERAELDVLAGLAEDDWGTIAQIVVEVHDEDGRCAALGKALDARGFRVVGEQEPLMRGTDVHMVYATR